MKAKTKQIISVITGLAILGLLLWGFLWLVFAIWHRFVGLDANLAVGLLTAFTTVFVAALTVTFGRYFERKKEVEAHFRDKKSVIYDEFLGQFFKLSESGGNVDLVPFLREWQRKVLLWGGAKVLTAYLKWMANLKQGTPDAQPMFLMDDFFRALRRDLGLSNRGIQRGAFMSFILKHPEVLLQLARENPNVTLDQVSEKEKELGLES